MQIVVIAAIDDVGGIGKEGSIPWHYPEDMKWFKTNTLNHAVIMGRKTFNSLNNMPLPKRFNLVLTRELKSADFDMLKNGKKGELLICLDLDVAIGMAKRRKYEKCFIIGGAEVYRQALDMADEIILTHIPGKYDCDTFFPEWPLDNWREDSRIQQGKLNFITYKKKISQNQPT